MKLLNIFLFITFHSLFSCKKNVEEVTINSCQNGVKDDDEEAIDCGGACSACYHYPYLVLKQNGEAKQASSKSIVLENVDYKLLVGFDTVLFQLNLGSNLAEGTYNLNPLTAGLVSGTKQYTFVSGIFGISRNDLSQKQLSGNFEAKFVNLYDTLRIESGQFEYLDY